MNLDRLLGIIGIVIGVPGFLILFMSDKWIEGILVLFLVMAIAGYQVYLYKQSQEPMFTVLRLDKEVRIHDDKGTKASFERRQHMKTNHPGLVEWWCRNIAADGTITNILIDGQAPDVLETSAGTIRVCRRFPRPLQKGEELTIVLTYDLTNSFLKNTESVVHLNVLKTREVVMSVELPRPCLSAETYMSYGGQQVTLINDKPAITMGNKRLEIAIKKPRLGAQYHLQWTW